MFAVKHVTDEKGNVLIQDPPIAQFLFSEQQGGDHLAGRSPVHRLRVARGRLAQVRRIRPGWRPARASSASGQRALGTAPNGKPIIVYDWYRTFIQFLVDSGSHPWFAKVIVFGELAVGLGLIVGALVGVAAFFGALMNMSFLMAGTVSTNPVLFFAAILLILAWKNAGYLGIDRYLLPMLGTPWKQPSLQESTPQAVLPRAA